MLYCTSEASCHASQQETPGVLQGDDDASHKEQVVSLQQRLEEALAAEQSAGQQHDEQVVVAEILRQQLGDAERQATSAAAAATDALNQQLDTELAASDAAASASGQGAIPVQQDSAPMRELLEAKDVALVDASRQVASLQKQHEDDMRTAASLRQQLKQVMQSEHSRQPSGVSPSKNQPASAPAAGADEKKQGAAPMQQLFQPDDASTAAAAQLEQDVASAEANSADLRLQLEVANTKVQEAAAKQAADSVARRDANRRANDLEAELSILRTTVRVLLRGGVALSQTAYFNRTQQHCVSSYSEISIYEGNSLIMAR